MVLFNNPGLGDDEVSVCETAADVAREREREREQTASGELFMPETIPDKPQ